MTAPLPAAVVPHGGSSESSCLYSMEFHGTRNAPISMTRAVPWNSSEFHGTMSAPISVTRAVPWNSMEIGVRQFRWHKQFHGIPCSKECSNFVDTSSPVELGVCRFLWHEQFRGIPWISMELEVRQLRWLKQFYGIPRNLWCANFEDTSSSMEFHRNWSASISLKRAILWNSI